MTNILQKLYSIKCEMGPTWNFRITNWFKIGVDMGIKKVMPKNKNDPTTDENKKSRSWSMSSLSVSSPPTRLMSVRSFFILHNEWLIFQLTSWGRSRITELNLKLQKINLNFLIINKLILISEKLISSFKLLANLCDVEKIKNYSCSAYAKSNHIPASA